MITKDKILKLVKQKGQVSSSELVDKFSVSRQYVNRLLKELRGANLIIKLGSTRDAYYIDADITKNSKLNLITSSQIFENKNLEEHIVLDQISHLPQFSNLPENVKSIFDYAFQRCLIMRSNIPDPRKLNLNLQIWVNH